jgi:hypothetical protein
MCWIVLEYKMNEFEQTEQKVFYCKRRFVKCRIFMFIDLYLIICLANSVSSRNIKT